MSHTDIRTRLLTAALDAAGRGFHVFPLVPGHKTPAIRGWQHRATTDPDRISRCWSAGPYGIGIATGPSRLLVVDLDVPKPSEPNIRAGQDVFDELCRQANDPLPHETFTIATPSGGFHLYYQAPEGVPLRNSAGSVLGPKVDTRANGGYVVGAGSLVKRREYNVILDAEPRPLPPWLVEKLRPMPPSLPARVQVSSIDRRARYLDAAVCAEVRHVEQTRVNRNAALWGAAVALGRLVAGGCLDTDQVTDTLMRASAAHVANGAFSTRQAAATIASGLRTGAQRPRHIDGAAA